jgi:hypothetical protein
MSYLRLAGMSLCRTAILELGSALDIERKHRFSLYQDGRFSQLFFWLSSKPPLSNDGTG